MGLFEKKFCDFCGEKIGLLGNRKLEDGNMCKDCAKAISPWLTDRRRTTVAEMKEHLAYRETNKSSVAVFNPSASFGSGTKLYVDAAAGRFIATGDSTWQDSNPDVLSIADVTAVNLTVNEDKDEVFRTNSDGTKVSYNPKKYTYEYKFTVEIKLSFRWFDEIEFELSSFGHRPDSSSSPLYNQLQMTAQQIAGSLGQNLNVTLTGSGIGFNGNTVTMPGITLGAPAQQTNYVQPQPVQQVNYAQPLPMQQMNYAQPQPSQQMSYAQPLPMQQTNYAQPQPAQQAFAPAAGTAFAAQAAPAQQNAGVMPFCPNCGAQNSAGSKFCPNCGTPLTK